jgi:hypothetical protein
LVSMVVRPPLLKWQTIIVDGGRQKHSNASLKRGCQREGDEEQNNFMGLKVLKLSNNSENFQPWRVSFNSYPHLNLSSNTSKIKSKPFSFHVSAKKKSFF